MNNCLNYLPVAVIINDKVLCVHGGLSPDLKVVKDIEEIQLPTEVGDSGIITDLLWSSYCPTSCGFHESPRGVSYTYGSDVLETFLLKNHLEVLCNGTKAEPLSNKTGLSVQGKVISFISAPNYCGEFDNEGVVLLFTPEKSQPSFLPV